MTAVGKVITCWEVPLDGSGTYRIAEWKSHGDIEEMIVNEDPKHHIHVVCLTPDPMRYVLFCFVFVLSLRSEYPRRTSID